MILILILQILASAYINDTFGKYVFTIGNLLNECINTCKMVKYLNDDDLLKHNPIPV